MTRRKSPTAAQNCRTTARPALGRTQPSNNGETKSETSASLYFPGRSSGHLLRPRYAGEVKSIAILTPEEGTDFGWNQQGVDAAKAAGEKTGVEVMVARRAGLRRRAPDRCASWPTTAPA